MDLFPQKNRVRKCIDSEELSNSAISLSNISPNGVQL